MGRGDLSDEPWSVLEPLLPVAGCGRPAGCRRLQIDEIRQVGARRRLFERGKVDPRRDRDLAAPLRSHSPPENRCHLSVQQAPTPSSLAVADLCLRWLRHPPRTWGISQRRPGDGAARVLCRELVVTLVSSSTSSRSFKIASHDLPALRGL